MWIYGQIIDSQTGAPLPGATVSVLSSYNIPKLLFAIAGNDGFFEFNNPAINDNDNLLITHTEHLSLTVPVADVWEQMKYDDPIIPLQRKIGVLSPVLVDTHIKSNSGAGYLGLAALLLLTMANKKKKAVGEIKRSDVITGGLVVAGLFGFKIIQNLLEAVGIFAGAGNNQASQQQSNPNSPWKPAFYQSSPSGALLITESRVQEFIQTIHDAFTVINDDFNAIMSVFTQLKTQSQVSYLSYKFTEKYSEDLLSFLRDGGGVLPWDGLSSAHMKIITDLVNNLPKYQP